MATYSTIDGGLTPAIGSVTRVTAGGPAPGQVAKNYTGVVTLSASQQTITIETVTTGKSYLITDIIATSNDSANILLIQLQAAGTTIFQSHINSTKGIEAPGLETQPTATSGQLVQLVVPAGTVGKQVAWNIYGIEA